MSGDGTAAQDVGGGRSTNGLYRSRRRWFAQLPTRPINQMRTGIYSGVGRVMAVRWRPQRVMILSHMRSGSSLLTQLLASHDEIVGYGELFLHYRRRSDLWALNGKSFSAGGERWPRGRYAIDKVLHDYLLETDDYAKFAGEVSTIILVREPAGSIGSLITSFGMTDEAAFDYYTGRLRTLARYAETGGAVALSYDQLIHQTDEVFTLLEHFLNLEVPLQEVYRPRSRGSDPSANLRAGRILRDDKVVDHRVTVDENLLLRAQDQYELTWGRLTDCCQMST